MSGRIAPLSIFLALAVLGSPRKCGADFERDGLRPFCQQTLVSLTESDLRTKVASAGLEIEEDLGAASDFMDAQKGYESPAFVMTLRRVKISAPSAMRGTTCDVTIDTRGDVDTVELLHDD